MAPDLPDVTDLALATASDLVRLLACGSVSSREVLDHQLATADRWGAVNAVVAKDLDRAFVEAAAADAARAGGQVLGPLHGLPMTVKDTFETEGLRTTAGAPELAGHVPGRDADTVANLRRASAVVWGKTNTPLYAGDWQTYNAVHGLTRNPWDLSRTPGGSSGGSAAAVATGISALELGSDIGGSIRVPAHFCGVFGHKPTWGVLSGRGHVPGPPGTLAEADLAVCGPLGRSVADLELALDVLSVGGFAGLPGASLPPPAEGVAELRGCRIGLWLDDPACPVSGDVAWLLERAATALADHGAILIDDTRTATALTATHAVYRQLLTAVLAPGFPVPVIESMRRRAGGDPLDPQVREAGWYVQSHTTWMHADEARHRVRAEWEDVFSRVEVVLAPIAPIAAFGHDTVTPFAARTLEVDGEVRPYGDTMLVWPGVATLPGLPATAVPVGRTPGGLPVGVQVIGPRFADRTCLAVAAHLEAILGGFVVPGLP